jgi:PAS domain S-box-containing protein
VEDTLQESEEKFRLLFEKSVDPILLLDGDIFIECNEAAARLMSCSGKEQLIGLHPWDLSPERQPDGRLSSEKARELIDATLREGVLHFEWMHHTFNGEDLWIDVSITTIPLSGKRIMYTLWRDITTRKRAEEALQAAHQQLSEIIEFLPDATFVIDLAKRVIAWNRAIEEMTGVKKEDMLGKGDYAYAVPFYGKPRPVTIDLVLERDAERIRQYDFVKPEGDALLAAGYVPMTYEGKGAHLSAKASPLFDAEGHVIGAIESIRDLTEQIQTEEALMQSEKKYRSIFDNALEGIFQTTPDGRYLTVNPALARMYGYDSPGEMMEAVTDLQGQQYVVPEDRVRLKALYRQQGFVKGFETQIYTKNRDKVWISMNAQAVTDPEGNTLHYEGTTENITERKRAEEELQKAHRRLSDIIDFLPDATFVIDREKRVVAWNKAIEEMTGLKKEEILGKGDYAYAVPFYGTPRPVVIDLVFERNEEMEKTYDHVQGLGSRLSVEVYVPKIYRGRGAYLSATASPLFDHEGNVVGAIETIRDTTEQKRIEKALQESEERYRVAIEHSNDGVALVRGDRHIYVNQKFLEIFGYRSLEEVVGKSHCLTVHPDDRQKVVSYNHRRQRGEAVPNRYEFKGLRKNGEIVYIEASVTGTTYQGEPISLAFLRDVTGRRSLEAQLLQAQKIEAIGTLAGGVAHDFNNILMVLMGYANLLQMKMGQNDPSRVYVDQILASTAKAANITQSLLAFGRKQVMEMKPHKITTIVKDVEKLLRRLMPEDIGLTIKLGDDATIMADMTQIDQVLINLATNARDAMPNGGRVVIETGRVVIDEEFRRTYGYGKPGFYALLSVNDTGIGMDGKTKERIFEPFFTTKEVGKGTGLGLSIVYGIVKQHNGYINVSSRPGGGSTFLLYLPEVKEKPRETKSAVREAKGGSETLLLAEDNADIRAVMSDILKMSGYTVIEAADGRDAVEKFSEHQSEIKLIILDVVMPEKNGKEAYEEIRTMRHDVKALFMSGYTADVVLDKGVFGKTLDYIAKPIAPNELLHKVRNILDR